MGDLLDTAGWIAVLLCLLGGAYTIAIMQGVDVRFVNWWDRRRQDRRDLKNVKRR